MKGRSPRCDTIPAPVGAREWSVECFRLPIPRGFSSAVTLSTVASAPVDGAYTTIGVSTVGSFRYLRYLGPNGSYGNVAEVQFFGVPLPSPPSGLGGKMIDGAVTLTWNASVYANTYTVKRSTTSGGPYTTVATDLTGVTFSESNLAATGNYYYVVTALNEAGESVNSPQASISDAYSQWQAQQGWVIGSAKAAFGGDADGDGVPNGVEYENPTGTGGGWGADIHGYGPYPDRRRRDGHLVQNDRSCELDSRLFFTGERPERCGGGIQAMDRSRSDRALGY